MFERTTLEWVMSPQMRTSSPLNPPFFWRMVRASRRACVGCSWAPSPAFTTTAFVWGRSIWQEPGLEWRMT